MRVLEGNNMLLMTYSLQILAHVGGLIHWCLPQEIAAAISVTERPLGMDLP